MGGKKHKRNPMPDWAKEAPGVVIQVYRRRRDDRKRWEYLGLIEPEWERDLNFLETAHAEELDELVPFPTTQQRWGGGKYQFRFFWRDEEGRRELKRTRNANMAPPRDQW